MNKLIALFFVVSGVSVLAGCAGSSQEVNSYLSQGGLPLEQGDNVKAKTSTHYSKREMNTTTAKSESATDNSAKAAAENE